MLSATSWEIAWRARPTSTVTGPPNGARANILTRVPGTSSSSAR